MKNLGIYIRKSRDSEKQKSIKEQILLGSEFCKENKFNPIIYNDGIVSGSGKTNKRPLYEKMLVDIADGKLYGIYIWNTDRTARDEIAWHTLANLLKEHNVYLYDNGTKADFSDENTLLFYTIKSGMDAYFSRVTSSKIKAVLKRNASEGRFSGILKYGYKRDKNGVTIIDEEKAIIVKKMFELCINGSGYTAIAEYLNNNNIPTRYNQMSGTFKKDINLHGNNTNIKVKDKKDAKWSTKVIGDILRSRNYIGEKTYQGKIIQIPKIIPLLTFDKAQERINKRLNKSGKISHNKYLLNNVLMCSNCGKRYTGRKVNKHLYYRCASRIKKGESCGSAGIRLDFLDELIWNYFFVEDNLINALYLNFKQAKDQPKASTIEKELKTLGNSLNGKEKEISNVTKYLIQDIIKESEANTQLKRIRTEIVDINLKIERKTETLNSLSKLENDIKTYDDEIVNLRLSSSFDDRKKIIEKHLKEIKIINIDGYFTIDLIFKSFYFNERFIIEKNYKMHIVDIDTDDEYRAKGHKNLIDWEMNVYDWEKDINDWGKPVWDLVNRKI
jgi:DNA invertase Pin-like site-specific DNA recombinase